MKRLLGGPALAVNGRCGHGLGPTSREQSASSDVEGLLANLRDAPHDDVVDDARIELVALNKSFQRFRRKIHGVPVLQCAVALSAGSTNRIDDNCSRHYVPFGAVETTSREAYSSSRSIVTTVTEIAKNMERWLGDGGMALIGAVGATFDAYGVDGEDLGWVEGALTPTELACIPTEPCKRAYMPCCLTRR